MMKWRKSLVKGQSSSSELLKDGITLAEVRLDGDPAGAAGEGLESSEFLPAHQANSDKPSLSTFPLDPPLLFPKRRQDSNFFERWLFTYMNPVIQVGYKRSLESEDYMALEDIDQSARLAQRIWSAWGAEQTRNPSGKPKLWKATVRAFFRDYLWSGLAYFIEMLFKVADAVILGYLLIWFRDPRGTLRVGMAYATALVFTVIVHNVIHQVGFFQAARVGLQVKAGFITVIYQKSLRLSTAHSSSAGAIINTVANDVQRFEDAAPLAHFIWLAPLQVFVMTYFMYLQIDNASFVAIGTTLLIIPLQLWFAGRLQKYRIDTVRFRDSRIRAVSDAVFNILGVKLNAWEEIFQDNVSQLRDQEMSMIRKASVLRALDEAIYFAAAVITELFTFGAFWFMGGTFTPARIFTTVAYLNAIRLSVCKYFPIAVQYMSESSVSFDKIQKFLSLPEIQGSHESVADVLSLNADGDHATAVVIKNGTFFWKSPESSPNAELPEDFTVDASNAVLKDINLMVDQGELTAVVGRVGAGKSSLINALLNEMIRSPLTKMAMLSRNIAHCTQTPFIISDTIRENITFGKSYDAAKFSQVISVCGMENDLRILPHGQRTVVGERGYALSTGQRARLSLARAVYSDADIFLLDDPLSAIDPKLGRQIFDNCIKTFLAGKTRIFVTQQPQYARNCDSCVLLDSGTILAKGAFSEVMNLATASPFSTAFLKIDGSPIKNGDVDMNRIAENFGNVISKPDIDVEDIAVNSNIKTNSDRNSKNKFPVANMDDEISNKGPVGFHVYWQYFRSGVALVVLFFLAITVLSGEVSIVMTDYYLSQWSESSADEQRRPYRPALFAALVLLTLLLSITRTQFYFYAALNSSEALFKKMLKSVLRGPMRFFHETPRGRIMNRFSKDQALNDEFLPQAFFDYIQSGLSIIGTLGLAIAAIPYIMIFIPIVAGGLWYFRLHYIVTSRQVRRYEAVTRSPIYARFVATLEGLSSIRAFKSTERAKSDFNNLQNENTRMVFCYYSSVCWLGLRLDILASCLLAAIAFFAVGIRFRGIGLNSGLVGLLLSYAMQLTGSLQYFIKQSAEVENAMVSVERVIEYTKIPPEERKGPKMTVKGDWPSKGEIALEDMSAAYTTLSQPVLKNITISFPAGRRIGIVGRNGAGKSSLMYTLLRLIEPSPPGRVTIDGVNISEVALVVLRSRISIIPQEPFCFNGTVRYNIDPLSRFSDAAIWHALECVHVKEVVEKLPLKLDTVITGNGGNWSAGQRQLLCLARAILQNSRIIILDEATSAVDINTETTLKNAMRSESGLFASSTVLMVAHRLQTIIDFDFVLVLDDGCAVEFGQPLELLRKPTSDPTAWFSRMAHDAGSAGEERLTPSVVHILEVVSDIRPMVARLGERSGQFKLSNFRSSAWDLPQSQNLHNRFRVDMCIGFQEEVICSCDVMYDMADLRSAPDLILSQPMKDVRFHEIPELLQYKDNDDMALVKALDGIRNYYIAKEKARIKQLGVSKVTFDLEILEHQQALECTLKHTKDNILINFYFSINITLNPLMPSVPCFVNIEYKIIDREVKTIDKRVRFPPSFQNASLVRVPRLSLETSIWEFTSELEEEIHKACANNTAKPKAVIAEFVTKHFQEHILEYDSQNFDNATFYIEVEVPNTTEWAGGVVYMSFYDDLPLKVVIASSFITRSDDFTPEAAECKIPWMNNRLDLDVLVAKLRNAIKEHILANCGTKPNVPSSALTGSGSSPNNPNSASRVTNWLNQIRG